MLYSDSTHLAVFGTTSLWPVYLSFGNQSKYERAKTTSNALHHIAYLPKLPDQVSQLIYKRTGKVAPTPLLAHCKQELMHAIWKLILGDSFEEVYRHGIIINCSDGITRHLYSRFFTYSADYPEKVLLATIRDMGAYPCLQCLVPKSSIHEIGYIRDANRHVDAAHIDNAWRRNKVETARKFIYDQGRGITSKAVEDQLQEQSLVPTENAFSSQLSKFLPNFHQLFGGKVAEFDHHFQMVPSFGTDTIRTFGSMKVSEMKKMAARNFEDILQCIIPIFNGLLPEPHNKIVIDLLFSTPSKPFKKEFNLQTYKIHSLGDYTDIISKIGTTDSYTTQTGECEHCNPELWFPMTSKRSFEKQLAHIEHRKTRMWQLEKTIPQHGLHDSHNIQLKRLHKQSFSEQISESISLFEHHHISKLFRNLISLPLWLHQHAKDPALKNFLLKLKIYLLSQLDSLKN
ncbi:hypothetical protein ABKN59_007538 [Abortiporus biennis]